MQLSLFRGYSPMTMLAVAAVALILTGLFYHRAFHALGFRRWRTLYLLRAAAVLIVVTLLFQPVLSYQKSGRTNRH